MSLNPPLADWRGKTAWLIGASSGIGRATASALHARGAKVFVSARNARALDLFTVQHPGAVALPLDVVDPAALKAATAAILELGGLDCVMYCAGHYTAQRATDFSLAEMLKHEQINYVGALYMLDAVLPQLLQARAGHISLVSSVAGYRGLPQGLAYGPTKAALINLAETLYEDLHAILHIAQARENGSPLVWRQMDMQRGAVLAANAGIGIDGTHPLPAFTGLRPDRRVR